MNILLTRFVSIQKYSETKKSNEIFKPMTGTKPRGASIEGVLRYQVASGRGSAPAIIQPV